MDAGPEELRRRILEGADPRQLLRSAAGAGVRVAVVDSGIDRELLADRARKRGREPKPIIGLWFNPLQREEQGPPANLHGTIVADILSTLAPEAELFSADVIGSAGACEVEAVVQAIEHAVHEWKCRIVNLSLGIPEGRLQVLAKRHLLQRAVERAYHQDVLVFAAAHNEHPVTRSYPSLFAPPLVSVDKGDFEDPLDFAYSPREQVEFRAYAKGYMGPLSREPATSWATPHLAGIAAKLLSLDPGMKPFEVKTLLYWMGKGSGG